VKTSVLVHFCPMFVLRNWGDTDISNFASDTASGRNTWYIDTAALSKKELNALSACVVWCNNPSSVAPLELPATRAGMYLRLQVTPDEIREGRNDPRKAASLLAQCCCEAMKDGNGPALWRLLQQDNPDPPVE